MASRSEVSRRAFLAGAAGVAATATFGKTVFAAAPAAAPAAVPPAANTGRPVGFALMGIGLLTKGQLIPAFKNKKTQWAKPVAFVTGHREQNLPLAAELGIKPEHVYTYENYDSIKNNPEIEVVYNVLPNDMHAEYTIRGFKAGKHVLCEKPMANSVEDCQKMIAAAKEAKKRLMIGYRMQYEPMTKLAIQLARTQLGDLRSIQGECGFVAGANNTPANYWRLNKKQAGGGAMMDMGIYALQAIRYLSGQEPNLVSAIAFQPKDNPQFTEVEQTMNVALQFPSGMQASILTSYSISCNRVRAYGSRNVLEMEPLQNYSNNKLYLGRGQNRQEQPYTQVDHFAVEMDEMAQCVINDREPLTNGEEGLRDVRIMAACFESIRTGSAVKIG